MLYFNMVIYMNMDINENQSSSGNKGKFSERLKKIRRDKLRKNATSEVETEENIFKHSARNILKIFLALPSVAYSVIKDDKKTNNSKKLNGGVGVIKVGVSEKTQEKEIVDRFIPEESTETVNKKIKVNKIKELDVSLLRRQKELLAKSNDKKYSMLRPDKKSEYIDTKGIDKQEKIEKLQKEIINLVKKNLLKTINELEILQSELYLLKELSGEDIYLNKCQDDIKEIKKLLSKIKALKEKYDYLKDNVSFECILEYNDNVLIDKVLELKDMCSDADIKYVVDNYKLLDEFKFLYLKIDKLQQNTIKYDDYKTEKEQELKERDIDFENVKTKVFDFDKENERYRRFVREQEAFLKELENKIFDIDANEVISLRLKGFNQLLANSFKYLGLLLINPLKGLIPGIVTQTLITKNVIRNLYKNLEWEEERKIVYEAIDYSNSIDAAINNLDNSLSLVNTTLEEVIALKQDYEKKFSKYKFSLSSYRDTISKLNKMENAILGNKIKIEMMQEKMRQKERENKNKLEKVKKLNSSKE